MNKQGILKQTSSAEPLDCSYWGFEGFSHASYFPPATGFSCLIDGTVSHIANNVSGDTIKSESKIIDYPFTINSVGVVAVKLDNEGYLQALAAGGLKSFKNETFEYYLDERLVIALWTDKGNWKGIVQGIKGMIPPKISKMTKYWIRLNNHTLLFDNN